MSDGDLRFPPTINESECPPPVLVLHLHDKLMKRTTQTSLFVAHSTAISSPGHISPNMNSQSTILSPKRMLNLDSDPLNQLRQRGHNLRQQVRHLVFLPHIDRLGGELGSLMDYRDQVLELGSHLADQLFQAGRAVDLVLEQDEYGRVEGGAVWDAVVEGGEAREEVVGEVLTLCFGLATALLV